MISQENTLIDMLQSVVASLHRSYKRQLNEPDELSRHERCECILIFRQAAKQRLHVINTTARFMEKDTLRFETALQKAQHDINEAAIDALHTLLEGVSPEKQLLPERSRQ